MRHPDPTPVSGCAVSRDVQNFDFLVEDMEAAFAEGWGDLGFAEASDFLDRPEAEALELVVVALDEADAADPAPAEEVIARARARKVKVILIAPEPALAALADLSEQADDIVPAPLAEGALQAAIARMRRAPPAPAAEPAPAIGPSGNGCGAVIAVHGLAGGTGATTLAVNLAWELAHLAAPEPPRVCLIDLDLQFGSVSTYLDLARREAVFEMWSDTSALDEDMLAQSLQSVGDRLWVLTAPADILPLDMITPEDVGRVITLARERFDYVIIDMPTTLVHWSETVLGAAQIYFATLEPDMRSAQNVLRLKRALAAEDLPLDRLRFCVNRAPKFTDLGGKARLRRMADTLEIGIELQLPEGGRAVGQSADEGLPLAASAARNPLRKEIARLATSLHALARGDAQAT